MGDVERPSNGDKGGGAGQPSHGLPARNMADIARLFLEGARPLPTRITAHRRGPNAPEPASAAQRETPPSKGHSQATALFGLAGTRHAAANWKLLVQAARGLAQEMSTAVAVVGLLAQGNKTHFVVEVAGVESADQLPAVRSAGEGGSSDLQVARALHRLAPAVGTWIISAPPCDARAFAAIGSIVREWLLACPTDNDGLIAGYQYLKQAWLAAGAGVAGKGAEEQDRQIVPTVYLLSEDYAQASVVHKRLRKAAQEFLGTDLALAGAGPMQRASDEGGMPEPLRVLSVDCPGPDEAVWAAVLDELCPMTEGDESFPPTQIESALDHVEHQAEAVALHSAATASAALDHLAQVLDPEEREALAADFAEPGVPVATPRRAAPESPEAERPMQEPAATPIFREPPRVMEDKPLKPASAAETATKNEIARELGGGTGQHVMNPPPSTGEVRANSLRAFNLAGLDRAGQWQAVERSIGDLSPGSALLDARPPMSWASETCISIDGQGRVNVWTLYKDGASWFALREWASEHRNLLALTRRDLAVDKNAEVIVHMVLPLEEPGEQPEGVVGMLLRAQARNLCLYRMRTLAWNAQRGMLVVPLA